MAFNKACRFEVSDDSLKLDGDGTVTEIVDDPRDYKVTIQFDGAGQKIMYAAFAKLKKL